MAGRKGDYAYIDEHVETFIQEYQTLLEKIEEVLKKYDLLENMEETEQMLQEDMIFQVLRNIENHIENFAFSQIFEILEEVKKCKMPEKYKKVFEQIQVWMDDLQVEKIQQLIEETIKKE